MPGSTHVGAVLLSSGSTSWQAEERLRATMDALLDPLVLVRSVRDETGRIVDFIHVDANQAACVHYGVSCDELVGGRLLDVLPGYAESGLLEVYRRVVESGQSLLLDDVTYPREPLGGEMRRYDVRAVRVGDGLSCTWRDVTERHETAAALAASGERYRLLAENASDVVVRADNQGVIQWISPSVTALMGWSPEQLVGEPFADLVHADDLPSLGAAAARLLGGEPARPEVRVRAAAGGYRWIAMSVRPIFDDTGAVVGRIAGWRDAQVEMEAQHSLRRHVRELDALHRIFQLLAELSDLGEALDAASLEIVDLFDACYAHVHLFADETAASAAAFESVGAAAAVLAPGEAAVVMKALAIGCSATSESAEEGSGHILGVPMVTRSQVVGVLAIGRERRAGAFGVGEMAVAKSVAEALAAAVENERLHERQTRQAAADERQRLARDLHDSVTQSIYSANLIAEVLPGVWERSSEEGLRNLAALRRLVRAALAEMRTLLFELRPEALAATSLESLLDRLGDALTGQGEIAVEIAVEKDLILPVDVRLAFYRVAQEALTNVGKHAQAARVVVVVAGGDAVRLTVHDDGKGFDRDMVPPESMGLRIMAERAAETGAALEIDGASGDGTMVSMVWRRPVSGAVPR